LVADEKFKVKFNKGKQWFYVCLYDVSLYRFNKWAGTRWGFYWYRQDRNRYRGHFGDVHLVKSRSHRIDLYVHEAMLHLLKDWASSRKLDLNNVRREEELALLLDELYRNYLRAWGRHFKRKSVPIP